MRKSAHVRNSAQRTNGGKIKNLSLLIVLISLAVSQFLGADTPPQELLGRWRSAQTSKGGLGLMLRFRVDGTYDFSPGAVVEMPYRIEGGELVFPPATTDGPEQRGKIQFIGQDQLRMLGEPGEELMRKGAAPNPKVPILGEWEGKRDMGGHTVEVRYLFYPDARCLLLIPFATRTLNYTIQGRNMQMEEPNQKPVSGTFQIKDGVLTITGPSGKGDDYLLRKCKFRARQTGIRHEFCTGEDKRRSVVRSIVGRKRINLHVLDRKTQLELVRLGIALGIGRSELKRVLTANGRQNL